MEKGIRFFDKYLTVWVLISMVIGVLIGQFIPVIPGLLSRWEYAHVNLPIALLIWLMIFPMMLKINFESITQAGKRPKGLLLTLFVNWCVKPFSMFGIAWLFFHVIYGGVLDSAEAQDYVNGAVLLGAAPCTAMVFVWSYLTKGDPVYTLVQVAINDLVLMVAYVPIVSLLLGVGGVQVPWETLLFSTVLYLVLPLISGVIVRKFVIRKKGIHYLEQVVMKRLDYITPIGLLLTLVFIFSFQGNVILNRPLDIVLIAIPLIVQTFVIFYFTYLLAKKCTLPHTIAAPASMIGASNFFELAVAVAISLFGIQSGATLVTVVGVLVEVPVMLFLVKILNKTRY